MASLKDTEQLTEKLEELVSQLRVIDRLAGIAIAARVVGLADELSEQADGLAETFSSVNDTLMQRLEQAKSGRSRGGSRQSESKSESKTATSRS